jgi:hypothetical protein
VTERKRASHFALMDTAFAADRKFIRLARKASIPIEYAAAVGVFWLLLADARRSKSPDVDWSEYDEYVPQIQLLRQVGLLDDNGFPPGPFNKWAPVYKSPSDAARGGTQGNEEVRNGTQGSAASVQFASPQVSSPQVPTGGVGGDELPGEDDSATAACRMFLNGGEWLGNREYVAAFDDMDRRYSAEWVKEEITPAYADVLEKRGKVMPWDLRRMVEWRLAQRTRADELAREKRDREAIEAPHRQKEREAMPEEKEQAALQRQAIRIGFQTGLKVPTDPADVRKFVMKHGSAA